MSRAFHGTEKAIVTSFEFYESSVDDYPPPPLPGFSAVSPIDVPELEEAFFEIHAKVRLAICLVVDDIETSVAIRVHDSVSHNIDSRCLS